MFLFSLLVSKSQLIVISLLKHLSSEQYAVNFFLINWLSIIQVGKVLIFFFEKEISVSLAYNFCGVVMYFFYLINWNYECPFERIDILIISIILCSTFTRVYIIFLFVLFCIEFFGTTEFHLIVCVTLFQCFQECVIRLIVKVTYYSLYFVDCIGSLLTVYANCIIFRFILECQGIVVLYMKWANCVFEYVSLFGWDINFYIFFYFLNCAKSMFV